VYDTFETSDDEKIFVGVVTDSQWKVFCEAFALTDLLADPRLKTNPQRVEARARIIPVVAGVFRGLTKAEAMQRCETLGLPFASITRPEDLFDDPHLNASGGLVPLELPNGMKTKSPILPLEMDGRRLGAGHGLPRVGEHTRELLLGLGYGKAEIEDLTVEGVFRV
jgi:crotonobetainyl-CoA:carnitine CoA-transferase CaiB-like acyl-CoA transferase